MIGSGSPTGLFSYKRYIRIQERVRARWLARRMLLQRDWEPTQNLEHWFEKLGDRILTILSAFHIDIKHHCNPKRQSHEQRILLRLHLILSRIVLINSTLIATMVIVEEITQFVHRVLLE